MARASLFLLLCLTLPCWAEWNQDGHIKAIGFSSLESGTSRLTGEARINVNTNGDDWSWQFSGVAADCNDDTCQQARVDRANLFWKRETLQITLGRHAISWGNGLIFNPVDIFNPFQPLAIDTEYKPGSDMLHVQYGLPHGDDIQALWVDHGKGHSSAIKYHRLDDTIELDFLLADHMGDTTFAFGLSRPLGDWLWRAEWMQQRSPNGLIANHVVTNLQRFFELAGQASGVTLELFHNGWGIDATSNAGQLSELTTRMARGEIFTPSKDYLALSIHRQMQPLWQLGLTHISAADNDSHTSQIFSNVNLSEAVQLRLALALPWRNSRLIKIPTERYLLAQLAWYF